MVKCAYCGFEIDCPWHPIFGMSDHGIEECQAIQFRNRWLNMDSETYQLLLDDVGDLVDALKLPLGEMLNLSPREVMRRCVEAVKGGE